MAMRLSPQGLYFLAAHEGVVPAPYLDSVGVWTYGIGHAETSGLPPNPRNMPRGVPDDLDGELRRVFDVFAADMEIFSAAVNRAVRVPMAQHEFDAAVSFHFNTGGIARATWVKTWNAGDKAKAAQQIMNWKRPPEIIPRRQAEQRLFATGDYGRKSVAVFGVSARHQPLYSRVLRRLSLSDVVGLTGARPVSPTPPPQRPTVAQPAPARPTGLAALFSRLLAFLSKGGPA